MTEAWEPTPEEIAYMEEHHPAAMTVIGPSFDPDGPGYEMIQRGPIGTDDEGACLACGTPLQLCGHRPMTNLRKHLVLHIEIPGYYADDLDDAAAMYSEPEPPGPQHRLDVVTEEWMRAEVGITLVSLPGEKCMNDDFEVRAYTGRIVGAETRDAPLDTETRP